ncbi:aldehyde dehydrogenase (NADP(+)) [Aliikangiella maris]|uniref:Aldehyde dehydrogenase (NADP(+)) n=2 Tax=Aliikangiella maris TaxID=3162458 RepID=A0ABV2BY34_9GAMM
MTLRPVLIDGQWRQANAESQFQAFNPTNGDCLSDIYPVSSWQDCDAVLNAASEAYQQLQQVTRQQIAQFLNEYADLIEANSQSIVEMANLETGLPVTPRLADVELPRTTSQLRQAASAALNADWTMPIIDSKNNIRAMLQSIGPVAVFGPNNFPLAFGSASGGDFAAAIAAGNPVIIKAHPSHPGTTRLMTELAFKAVQNVGLPEATVQLIYAMSNDSGLKLVGDARIAATGFTGSRPAGLALKNAAEKAGKLIYLELSSINPVIVLPGAVVENADTIANDFTNSCVMAAGQLCTKPGLLIVPDDASADKLVNTIAEKFSSAAVGTLLSPVSAEHIQNNINTLIDGGAIELTQASLEESPRFCQSNRLLSIKGQQFIEASELFQTEIFGNASLIIRSKSVAQTHRIIEQLEGNLTGCFYSHSDGRDDDAYQLLEPVLRQKVGRILNDKMPTGVAVSPAMNHGGPFPAAGHPGFTAVGMPAAIKRFAALKCFDGVRQNRLPDILADRNPGDIWRQIDGRWTTESL